MNVNITPSAEKFMTRMVRMAGGGGFRLEVSPGGCSGLAHAFDVVTEPQPGDGLLELAGVRVFLPPASAALLEGYTVDFVDTPADSGLKFSNPAASAACCGSAGQTVSVASIRRPGA